MSSFILILAVTTITFLTGSTNCCVSMNAGGGGDGGGGGGGHGAPSTGGGRQASSSHNQILLLDFVSIAVRCEAVFVHKIFLDMYKQRDGDTVQVVGVVEAMEEMAMELVCLAAILILIFRER